MAAATPATDLKLEHQHSLTEGAFRTGLKLTLGYLAANFIFSVIAFLGFCFLVLVIVAVSVFQSSLREKEVAPALGKVEVLHAKLYDDPRSFSPSPTIELEVRNNSGKPIKDLRFHAKLQTSGRTLPWAEDDLSYSPPGGLEPGETQTWKLSPSPFSEFYHAKPRDDAYLRVTCTDVEFAVVDTNSAEATKR